MIPREIRTTVVMACAVVLFCFVVAIGLYLDQRGKASRSAAEGRVAVGQSNVAIGAMKAAEGQAKAELDGAAQTQQNQADIQGADNATNTAGDAGSRGLRALCGRVQYRSDKRCVELLRNDRANASN